MLQSDLTKLGHLMLGMRSAYEKGENVMEFARRNTGAIENSQIATMIAYDLQAGSYILGALENPQGRIQWCSQLAEILNPLVNEDSTLLEIGCGEATTLAGVLKFLDKTPRQTLGFDISWSRCFHGLGWLRDNNVPADLFVADLFEIPLESSSVDVVYTSHSLEPNGGKERDALKELLRIARHAVVLIEPIYELADSNARSRMENHGYVRNLKNIVEELSATVVEYHLLDYSVNLLNPSGVVLIKKSESHLGKTNVLQWRCPLTHSSLISHPMGYYSPSAGTVYPVLGGIPLLQSSHAVVASSFGLIADKSHLENK